MWKVVFGRVQGESYRSINKPCQDSVAFKKHEQDGSQLFLVACADGAGSAAHSYIGARLASKRLILLLEEEVKEAGASFFDDRSRIERIFRVIHEEIAAKAVDLAALPRDLACTLLGAVLGDERSLFMQIGDGAIVIEEGEAYNAVFWPQNGEYANTTMFVTDDDYQKHLQIEKKDFRVCKIAVFTDGLERLALNFEHKQVHTPFFCPLFSSLKAIDDPNRLFRPMRVFLKSPEVNDRTSDDKTLLLALRTGCMNEATKSV